jgi:hypothetical protein
MEKLIIPVVFLINYRVKYIIVRARAIHIALCNTFKSPTTRVQKHMAKPEVGKNI